MAIRRGLQDLLSNRRVVIVETYPAEFYAPLGVRFGARDALGRSGKRQQHDRRAQVDALLDSPPADQLIMSDLLEAEIRDGFGPRPNGEDRFDALGGLLGMILVVLGRQPEGLPANDIPVRLVEGWILGRPSA